jgi:hypothetical protein
MHIYIALNGFLGGGKRLAAGCLCKKVRRYSVYFPYWYKSTNADTWGAVSPQERGQGKEVLQDLNFLCAPPPPPPLFFPALYQNRPALRLSGAPITPDYRLQYLIYHCLFLSLSLSLSVVWKSLGKPGGDCLRKKGRRYSVYLLYWCKSKNTDAVGSSGASIRSLLSLLALQVQK